MNILAIVLLAIAALIAMALFLAALSIAVLLIAAWRAERRERAGTLVEHVDQALDVARAQPWTGDNVIAQFNRRSAPGRRLSEGWIAYAETEFDWHAAEYMATRKAARR